MMSCVSGPKRVHLWYCVMSDPFFLTGQVSDGWYKVHVGWARLPLRSDIFLVPEPDLVIDGQILRRGSREEGF